jgi:hypothetical protein
MAVAKTSLDKRQTLALIEHFFDAFQKCCNQPGTDASTLFEPYLSKNFQLTSSDHHIARNFNDYLKHCAQYREKFSHIEIAGPTSEPVINSNRFAFQYTVDYTLHNGQKNEVFIQAIATVEDNKISAWSQVAHEKGTGLHWKA